MPRFIRIRGKLSQLGTLIVLLAGCSSDTTPAASSPLGGTGGTGADPSASGTGGTDAAASGSGGGPSGGSSAESGGSGPEGGTAGSDASGGGSGGSIAEGGRAGASGSGGMVPAPDFPDYGDYEGNLPTYVGPPVGPFVEPACPGDPTEGWTEYTDTFRVQRPYDVPIAERFKFEEGIYTFWVQENDRPHTRTTNANNPRTEARWRDEFRSGWRMFSADVMLEPSTNQVVIMQVHTTSTGIGPVYLHVEGNNRIAGSTVTEDDIPGGLFNNWFNLKVAINGGTTESQIYINNCLITTQRGTRGSGVNYFKAGVYHCETDVCRDHYKNIRLYQRD